MIILFDMTSFQTLGAQLDSRLRGNDDYRPASVAPQRAAE